MILIPHVTTSDWLVKALICQNGRSHLSTLPRVLACRRRRKQFGCFYSLLFQSRLTDRVSLMGSYSFTNFNNFGYTEQPNDTEVKQNANFPLVRQSSVFSLTFDEFQNTLGGGMSKDLGSINMEELLKTIWNTEEGAQIVAGGEGSISNGNLPRQGSLTLPRSLSQKTVDEVWREVLMESVKEESPNEVPNVVQNEPNLGEMTLEEFLFRAKVVSEDMIQPSKRLDNDGIVCVDPGLNVGFQYPTQNQGLFGDQTGVNKKMANTNSPNMGINASGVRSKLQPLFPKQTDFSFSTSVNGNNSQMSSRREKGMAGIKSDLNNTVVQGGGMVMGGMGNAIVKKCTEMPLQPPVPYNFSGTGRGRKSAGTLEKVVERRHKRMIKNRESASRSRARKQAYTLELEAEVAKLREMNEELQRKEEELLKMQKNQILEALTKPLGGKRRCLRRTSTGHW